MPRSLSCLILGLLLGCLGGTVAAPTTVLAQEHTMQGEIVDPASFLKDGRHGPELVDQTYEAVDGGQSLAVLEEGTGTLYLLLAEQPGEDPNELAYDYVNQTVKITGTLYERGGFKGIAPKSIEPANPPAASGPSATGQAETPAPSQELPAAPASQ